MDITHSVHHKNKPTTNTRTSSHTQKKTKSMSCIQQWMDDIQFFSNEAKAYQESGNLEETLAHYMLYGATIEHLLPHCKGKQKKALFTDMEHVRTVLSVLHQKVQTKADAYYGCLENDSDDPQNTDLLTALGIASSPHDSLLDQSFSNCSTIHPIDTTAFEDITLSSMVGNERIKQDIIQGIIYPFQQPLLFKMRRSFLFTVHQEQAKPCLQKRLPTRSNK